MAQKPTRDVFAILFRNFINSFKPRKLNGTLVGTDYNGTRYYEIPPQNHVRNGKASRWFIPQDGEAGFDQQLPAEWESWLRGRRAVPPTEEEVMKNLNLIQTKRENAKLIDSGTPTPQKKGMESFPHWPEYEVFPGVPTENTNRTENKPIKSDTAKGIEEK